MKHWKMLAVAAASSLLVACGGGGGGGSSTSETRSVAVSGTAAKGRMANALVTVHAVRDDGSVIESPLASTTTDAGGNYSLSFTGNPEQSHVVRVTAQAGTTHLDEVTGASQPLPAGFVMRSLLSPGVSNATGATITPFSEMAVAAAEKLGGLSSANTDRAVSTISQMLGFNPLQVAVKATSDATSTPDEQRLAVMLTAVSQLAGSGALGCSTGSAGENVKCVVDALSAATSATSFKLETGTTDVSASLNSAVQTVLNNPSLAGVVAPAVLTTTLTNLQCSDATCVPQAPSSGSSTVDGAIAAVKALFTQLRSDFTALFGLNTATTGAVGEQLAMFQDSMSAVQAPVEVLGKDLAALTVGIEHYNDYKAGRITSTSTQRGFGEVTTGPGILGERAAITCQLYQDSGFTVVASSSSNANYVFCNAIYYIAAPNDTAYRHGFRITPNTDGSFSYNVRAESRPTNGTPTGLTPFTNGTVQATSDSQGRVRSFQVSGGLPAAFVGQDGSTVVPGSFAWDLSGTRDIDATDAKTSQTQLSGTVTDRDTGGATRATLQIHSGSFSEVAGSLGPLGLDLTWTAGNSSFRGSFSTGATVADKSGTSVIPSQLVLEGRFSNLVNGAPVEFLTGKLTASVTGYGNYDSTQPGSATNAFSTGLAIQGSATAPGRPLLQFSGGTTIRSNEDRPALTTMQYRSIVDGAARMTVNASHYRDTAGVWISEINEVGSGVSIAVRSDAATADVRSASGTKIGELARSSGLLSFVDGSFISAELGQ